MTSIKSKMTIAMYLPFYRPLQIGGSEIQAERLAKELIRKGTNVLLITINSGDLPSFELIDSIPVFRINTIYNFFKRSKLTTSISTPPNSSDVIFDYSNKPIQEQLYVPSKISTKQFIAQIDILLCTFFFFFRKRKRFDILQINTVTYFAVILSIVGKMIRRPVVIKDSTMDGVAKMFLTPFPNLSRKFITKNSYFVAITEAIRKNFLLAGIPEDRIYKIHNGIYIINKTIVRPHFSNKCLFVGNLYQQPAKGIDILLNTWKEIQIEFPHSKLYVVGDGNINEYRNYCKVIGLSDSIIFTGKDDPHKYYLSCDIFILPSRREGMSNALMEAMLYKMPVIASDISGNQDLIENLKSGILFPCNCKKALFDAIVYAFKNPEEMLGMGEKARETVQKRCSMDSVSLRYLELYTKLFEQ